MKRIRDGDADAYEALFFQHAQSLIHFVWRFVKNLQISENIVQDVFCKIWLNREALDPRLSIKSYLFKAVKNQALQHLRHEKIVNRTQSLSREEDTGQSPEDRLQNKELGREIKTAIETLPTKCRLIFLMCKFDKMTYAEIAEIQEISIKTVETQMGRALKFLRKRLSHLLPD